MKLVRVSEMREIERAADSAGWSYRNMMEKAGWGLGETVAARLTSHSHDLQQKILGLIGTGNNGGDTLIALEVLARNGAASAAYLLGSRPPGEDLADRLRAAGGEIRQASADPDNLWLIEQVQSADAILDGVLGTGARLPLPDELANVLVQVNTAINQSAGSPPLIVAVDCPSGVDCESGAAAPETLGADLTVCMAAVKVGLLNRPAFDLTGKLVVIDIGLPEDLAAWNVIQREVASPERVRAILPARPNDAHKGTFGTALVIAGSERYCGAVLLAGKACHRIGTGLVTCATPRPVLSALAGQFPESTWLPLPDEQGWISEQAAGLIAENFERVTAVLLGPGLGTQPCTQAFVERLLRMQLPAMTIDADGLKILAHIPDWPARLRPGCILTPHPGEMAILSGMSVEAIQADRLNIAQRFAHEWGQTLILKGAISIVASPDGRIAVIPVATAALARAGTGDVLAGMSAGLLAQGVPAFEAALAAAFLHGRCGLLAERWLGSSASVLAGDVLAMLPLALQELIG